MKKSTIIVIVVIVLIAIWGITSYNGMVKMDESVSTAWSNVENQYQRRSDLIPNLVNTVKGYASHEKETFQAVVDARSKATQHVIVFRMRKQQNAFCQKDCVILWVLQELFWQMLIMWKNCRKKKCLITVRRATTA